MRPVMPGKAGIPLSLQYMLVQREPLTLHQRLTGAPVFARFGDIFPVPLCSVQL